MYTHVVLLCIHVHYINVNCSMYEPEPAELLMSPLPVGVENEVEASLDVSLTDKEEGIV